MDQNNIILVLLLIAVLVAFYAIYLGMENSKRIKKINLELNDALRLVDEGTRLKREMQEHPPQLQQPSNPELDEYPTLEEINQVELNRENLEQHENQMPLDNNLKEQIENLENMSEEELLNLERRLQSEESDELMDLGQPSNLEEIHRHNEEVTQEEDEDEEELDDGRENVVLVGGDDGEEDGEVVEEEEVEEASEEAVEEAVEEVGKDGDGELVEEMPNVESANTKYPELGDLTESILNEYNCEELREICKREELRTRGRKAELVERILKKRSSL
tara:strand:- start:429 stop:1256 length:828 start_codon:yes stop_codon:yes gene_type:complete